MLRWLGVWEGIFPDFYTFCIFYHLLSHGENTFSFGNVLYIIYSIPSLPVGQLFSLRFVIISFRSIYPTYASLYKQMKVSLPVLALFFRYSLLFFSRYFSLSFSRHQWNSNWNFQCRQQLSTLTFIQFRNSRSFTFISRYYVWAHLSTINWLQLHTRTYILQLNINWTFLFSWIIIFIEKYHHFSNNIYC